MKNTDTRHKFWAPIAAGTAGLFAVVGCESSAVTGSTRSWPSARASAPSSQVSKLDAWRDAEWLSGRSPGRSPAVGSGESMAPVYGDSTLLVIAKVEFDHLQPGMTVAYQNVRGRRVVHQLLESTSSGWRVQGLNNETADRERVTRENLIGVVYASLASDPSDD
jgi:hypothetical protein